MQQRIAYQPTAPPPTVGPNWIFYACALNILKSAFLVFNTTVSMKKKLKNHVFKMIQPIFEQSLYTIFFIW